MSRYCGQKNAAPILDAAAHWRDVAMLSDGSVFTTKRLWNLTGLEALDRYFVQNLEEGEGHFLDKLRAQLAPTEPAVKQLASEMLWAMLLCPSNISPTKKRETVEVIWGWSGEHFPDEALPWVSDSVLAGVGSGGPGFNNHRWRELVFFITTVLAFKRLQAGRREVLVADPWKFAEWLESIADSDARQLRHMLVFMLFPDEFERIFSKGDRQGVAFAFAGASRQAIAAQSPLELDRMLRSVRARLESEYGKKELDYYEPPLKDRWKPEGFSALTEGITCEHVRQALTDIDRDGVPADAESTGYDLIEAGRRYPPKLVLSLAAKHADGEELDRSAFSGGEASSAFRLLRKLGFDIEPKDVIPALIQKFIAQAEAANSLGVRDYPLSYRGLDVKVSFGKGNIARIPWIAFLEEGQSVSKGIYPVLLLFREQKVLLLCYGVSEENSPALSWGELGEVQTVQTWFRARLGRDPDRYGESYLRAAYELGEPLPIQDLGRELDVLIDQYKQRISRDEGEEVPPPSTPSLEVRQDLGAAARSFSEALRRAHVTFGPAHDDLVRSFIASLATKPFAILTGLSGSGKTQIAIRLGEWLGENRLYVAAVRPDWTGAEALFGYEDGLKPTLDGRAAWSVPAPLAFMLEAVEDPRHPFLLLLDEMNLAHVERYFADVLSGMESGQPCLPNLAKGGDGSWRLRTAAPPRIPFPRNLWIVGTVNVDETTYMFSPKVLDRANTFEFRVAGDDLQVDMRKPLRCDQGDQALVRGLLAIACDDTWPEAHPPAFRESLAVKLRQLHQLLARYGMEFGHRVFYESLRFAALAEAAGLASMEAVLDRIVMQKVVPRMHGSRRRLELPLLALAHYCRDLPEAVATDSSLPGLQLDQGKEATAQLPLSHDKLLRMLRSLRANQFVSFTE